MTQKITINKISDIIPLFNGKRSNKEVGLMIEPKKSASTIARWVKELRKAGYEVNTVSRGKPKLAL